MKKTTAIFLVTLLICVSVALLFTYKGLHNEQHISEDIHNYKEDNSTTQNGVYIDGKYFSESEMEQIRNTNFPTIEEVQRKYPNKTIITWLLSNVTFMDTIFHFPTEDVNEYLDSIGCDYAVCFIPLWDHNNNYIDTLNELINSGTQIDILSPSYSWNTEGSDNNYQRDALKGLLEPLDDYFVNTDCGKKYFDLMPDKYFEAFKVNGKIYGISGVANNFMASVGYSVDKILADKYNWDYDKPISEQISLLTDAKLSEKNMYAVYCGNYGDASYYPNRFDRWSGIFWDSEKDEMNLITKCDEYINGLDLLYTLQQNNLLTYDSPVQSEPIFIFLEGIGYYGEKNSDNHRTIDSNEFERVYVTPHSTKISNIINALGISSRSNNKEKAFEFLILSQTDAYLNNLLVLGVEGDDYYLENNRAEGTANVTMNFSRFGNLSVCYPFDNYSDTINQDYINIHETAEALPYLGFAFDVESVKNEYLAIKKVIFNHEFMSYNNAEESILELNKKLYDAGANVFLTEINRQYSEWKEHNE